MSKLHRVNVKTQNIHKFKDKKACFWQMLVAQMLSSRSLSQKVFLKIRSWKQIQRQQIYVSKCALNLCSCSVQLGTSGLICRWSSLGSVRASGAPSESFDPDRGAWERCWSLQPCDLKAWYEVCSYCSCLCLCLLLCDDNSSSSDPICHHSSRSHLIEMD